MRATFESTFDRAWKSANPSTPLDLAMWAAHYGDDTVYMVRMAHHVHPCNMAQHTDDVYEAARVAGRFARRALYCFHGG